ncbi:MAG TPA: ATP-binding cassette domain-containing protein, partial [Candidatus Methylomirabilis sp.]|nr:ATP-binding cassette domain-containing protein [Candidatus Methylomirabilis sp.]
MEPLLAVHQVKKHFGGVMALNGPSLGLGEGRIFGLIGPNGSGKTTLFNLITGLIPADSGCIHFKGRRIDSRPPYEIAQAGLGRTFQITRVFPRLTALENLLAVARDRRDAQPRARQLLELVGLTRLAGEYAGNLS